MASVLSRSASGFYFGNRDSVWLSVSGFRQVKQVALSISVSTSGLENHTIQGKKRVLALIPACPSLVIILIVIEMGKVCS